MDRKPMTPGDWVMAALFAATILVVTAQVASRYVFDSPFNWTEELSRLLFAWMIFVGAALAIREGTHIRVPVLVERLPARVRRYLSAGSMLLVAAFLGMVVVVACQWIWGERHARTPALGVPKALVWYSSLPVAAALGACFALVRAVRLLRGSERVDEDEEEVEEVI